MRNLTFAVIGAALLFGVAAVAEEPGVAPQGEQCPAPAFTDVNAQAAELMQRVIAQDVEAGQNPEADGDAVVLNNRGYNYGPPPGVRFDPILQGPAADSHAQ